MRTTANFQCMTVSLEFGLQCSDHIHRIPNYGQIELYVICNNNFIQLVYYKYFVFVKYGVEFPILQKNTE